MRFNIINLFLNFDWFKCYLINLCLKFILKLIYYKFKLGNKNVIVFLLYIFKLIELRFIVGMLF